MQLQRAVVTHLDAKGQLPYSASAEYFDPIDSQWHLQHVGWVTWFNYPADVRTYWWGPNGVACITNGSLFAFARDERIYLCPTFARQSVCGRADAVRSYVMNSQISGATTLRAGAHTLLFADGNLHRYPKEGSAANQVAWVGLRGWQNDWQAYDVPLTLGGPTGRQHYVHLDGELRGIASQAPPFPDEAVGRYHNGQANAVFLDGSVQKIRSTDTIGVCSGKFGDF